MVHRVYESFVLLPLKLCVKFEWSNIKDCNKYLGKCEITNFVMRADHVHFVAVRALSGCGQLAKPKIGGHVTLATIPFRKKFKGSCPDGPYKHVRQI